VLPAVCRKLCGPLMTSSCARPFPPPQNSNRCENHMAVVWGAWWNKDANERPGEEREHTSMCSSCAW
jgi:hypothetical protein